MFDRLFARITTLSVAALAVSAVPAQAQRPATWVVPDVVAQFNALAERADPLGFHIGDSPDPSHCKHYQGLTRIEGPDGTPYLIVTRSGNTPFPPGPPGCDDSPGETGDGSLLVVRMGSRDNHGERFRSNRQTKGASFDVTPPDPRDRVATWFRFQGGAGFPHYGHPGGMQAVGHMLAIAVEHPNASGLSSTVVLFVDMTDPINPAIRSRFSVANELGDKAGLVALTQLADGHYMMMVAGGANDRVVFYRSTISDLVSDDLWWQHLDTWTADTGSQIQIGSDPPILNCDEGSSRYLQCVCRPTRCIWGNWPTTGPYNGNAHQTLQFIREGSINGPLFLAGGRGGVFMDDFIDLYRVECDTPLCAHGEQVRMRHASTRRLIPHPNAGGDRLANLAAASTFYVSPSGELLFYASEHDNDGPSGTVKASEWRHRDMVRDGSPTLQPTLTVNGPVDIDEGSSGPVAAIAKQPVTKAWMQLFANPQYDGPYVVVDYDDYVLDDYNALVNFERRPLLPFGYYRATQSWRMFAPLFCNASAIGDDIFDDTDVPFVRTLAGIGGPIGNPDLTLIMDDSGAVDMEQRTSGVDFLEGCDTYYNTPFEIRWDRNGDGTFETVGPAFNFDAAAIDGPATFQIPVRSVHPVGGNQMTATAIVTVRNVAPAIAGFRVTNSAGQRIGIDVPFALVRTPVTVSATFTDPGVADHQIARVNWGDGVEEGHAAFTTFVEAFGGVAGSLAHTHRYALSGDHTLELSVTDDDTDVDRETVTVRVLTPEEALAEILALLDQAIATNTNPTIGAALRKGRIALVGHEQGLDGALPMLAVDQPDAAAAFVLQATDWLQRARVLGANTNSMVTLLQQVYQSLVAV